MKWNENEDDTIIYHIAIIIFILISYTLIETLMLQAFELATIVFFL